MTPNTDNPITPCGVVLRVGQVWKEIDPRFDSTLSRLTITGWSEAFKRTRDGKRVAAPRVQYIRAGRKLSAQLARFNGKLGGYGLEREP